MEFDALEHLDKLYKERDTRGLYSEQISAWGTVAIAQQLKRIADCLAGQQDSPKPDAKSIYEDMPYVEYDVLTNGAEMLKLVPREVDWGHGHVYPRKDGAVHRCGGPRLCGHCARDATRLAHDEDEHRKRWKSGE